MTTCTQIRISTILAILLSFIPTIGRAQVTVFLPLIQTHNVPTPVLPAIAVVGGGDYTCVLLSSGGVKCLGSMRSGWLGNGESDSNKFSHIAVPVTGLSQGGIAIDASGDTDDGHTCVLLNNGQVKCWGASLSGQTGDEIHATPRAVNGITIAVVAIATGRSHTCALLQSGGVKCWGYNEYGQLGDGSKEHRAAPVDVVGLAQGVKAIAAAGEHTCALLDSGGVSCWGRNDQGQVGDGTDLDRSTPVAVVGLSSGVRALTLGWGHSCALRDSGAVLCWGWNTSGQVGDGTIENRPVPTAVTGLGTGVAAMAAGGAHTCVVMTSGVAKCWGRNSYGQIGAGNTEEQLIPTNVLGLTTTVKSVGLGGTHTCAVMVSGGVKCWGSNWRGQSGAAQLEDQLVPVDVTGL